MRLSLRGANTERLFITPPIDLSIVVFDHLMILLPSDCSAVYSKETKCVGLARLGYKDQMIVAGRMKDLLDVDFGAPLHCLVIVGETHIVEEEMLEFYTIR